MKRINSLEYMRVIACIWVIMVHALWVLEPIGGAGIGEWIFLILHHTGRLCIPSFFLLTAVGLSNPKKDYLGNLKGYYGSKLISLGIPFFLWALFYYEYNAGNRSVSALVGSLPQAIKSVFTSITYYHMWYMYVLLGLTLLLPFIKRLLDHLADKELVILCILILLVQILTLFFGIKIDEFFLCGWGLYFFFGALLMRDCMKRFYPALIGLGILMTVVSVLVGHFAWETSFYNNIYDFSPIMIVRACGVFAFFLWLDPFISSGEINHDLSSPGEIKKVLIFWPKCNRVMAYLSKLTFEIYLAHAFVMNLVKDKLIAPMGDFQVVHPYVAYGLVVLCTFGVSGVIAAIIEGLHSIIAAWKKK